MWQGGKKLPRHWFSVRALLERNTRAPAKNSWIQIWPPSHKSNVIWQRAALANQTCAGACPGEVNEWGDCFGVWYLITQGAPCLKIISSVKQHRCRTERPVTSGCRPVGVRVRYVLLGETSRGTPCAVFTVWLIAKHHDETRACLSFPWRHGCEKCGDDDDASDERKGN